MSLPLQPVHPLVTAKNQFEMVKSRSCDRVLQKSHLAACFLAAFHLKGLLLTPCPVRSLASLIAAAVSNCAFFLAVGHYMEDCNENIRMEGLYCFHDVYC